MYDVSELAELGLLGTALNEIMGKLSAADQKVFSGELQVLNGMFFSELSRIEEHYIAQSRAFAQQETKMLQETARTPGQHSDENNTVEEEPQEDEVYAAELQRWKRSCAAVREQRAVEWDRSWELKQQRAELDQLTERLQLQRRRAAQAQQVLEQLGPFDYGRKKAERAELEDATGRIPSLERAVERAVQSLAEAEEREKNRIEREYPMPKKPADPENR